MPKQHSDTFLSALAALSAVAAARPSVSLHLRNSEYISARDRLDALMRTAGNKLDTARFAGRPWHQRVLDRMAFGVMRAVLFLTGHRY